VIEDGAGFKGSIEIQEGDKQAQVGPKAETSPNAESSTGRALSKSA